MRYTPIFAIPFPEQTDNTQTWVYWQGIAERLDAIVPRTACGNVDMVFASNPYKTAAISFPANRFTGANVPDVVVSFASAGGTGYVLFATCGTISITGFTGWLATQGSVSGSGTFRMCWQAMVIGKTWTKQAPVPQLDDGDTKHMILTCHTGGCSNADIEIPLEVPTEVEDYFCGVCSQPITDVRPALG